MECTDSGRWLVAPGKSPSHTLSSGRASASALCALAMPHHQHRPSAPCRPTPLPPFLATRSTRSSSPSRFDPRPWSTSHFPRCARTASQPRLSHAQARPPPNTATPEPPPSQTGPRSRCQVPIRNPLPAILTPTSPSHTQRPCWSPRLALPQPGMNHPAPPPIPL
jgi:hypothetical protein